ncbi:hypothetical protein ACRFBT_26485 [Pseudomonas aeruginosa]|uniref:hypothetical protein n=1 Tax=Pseudomonas aeruginosa TaxID=287 RepID=UPI003D6E32B8
MDTDAHENRSRLPLTAERLRQRRALDQPIKRGARPSNAHPAQALLWRTLPGLHLLDLLQFDVAATMKILPRISQPTITEPEAAFRAWTRLTCSLPAR